MFLLVCIILIVRPFEASEGAIEGIKTTFGVVLPSILPFAIASQGLIYTGFVKKTSEFFKPFFRLIGINPLCSAPLIISFLAGYPAGCRAVCDMYKENMIDKETAEDFLSFCNNGGIIFALNICGMKVFSSYKAGIIIFCAQLLSSIITAMLLTRKREENTTFSFKKIPLGEAVGKSIASGGLVIINIASALVVFYAVGNAICLDKVPFLYGLWEMTKGVNFAGEINSIPLAALFFSFGGASVFAQSSAFACEGGLKLTKLFLGKIISSFSAFLITWLFLYIC